MSDKHLPTCHNGAAHVWMKPDGKWHVSASTPRGSFFSGTYDTHREAFARAAAFTQPQSLGDLLGLSELEPA